MKKIVLLIVLLSAFGYTNSMVSNEGLTWHNWNEGFPKAQAQKKIALIDAYTDWCGWCKKMDKDTYEDAGIMAKINKHFVAIKFNPELAGTYNVGDTAIDGRSLLGALSQGQSSGFPTTFFYIPAKNAMYQFGGYMNPTDFHKVLDEMIAANNYVLAPTTNDSGN